MLLSEFFFVSEKHLTLNIESNAIDNVQVLWLNNLEIFFLKTPTISSNVISRYAFSLFVSQVYYFNGFKMKIKHFMKFL